ncbi:MAG: mercuric transporter MerT family protein [Thiobacillus sp.]
MDEAKKVKLGLAGGVIGTLLASVCCLGPLVLVLLGVGGAWVSGLGALYPFKPYLLAATAAFLAWSGTMLYRPKKACAIGSLCANPRLMRAQRIAFWAVVASVTAVVALPEILPRLLLA